jgi:PAS domain S-box-containing protein
MFVIYLPLLMIFFATVVSVLVVLYCLEYVRRYGATQQVIVFTIFAAAVTIWALFAMLQLAATTYESTLLAYQLLHFGAWGTPIPLLFYALSMGPARRWITRSTATALALTLVPLFILLFTAPTQYLFVEPTLQPLGSFSVIEHGNRPLYDAYLAWIYLLVFPALGYIAYQTGTDEAMSRGQSGIVVLSVLFPVLISVGQTLSVPVFDTPGTILTPLSLSLGMSGLGYAVFRYETFDVKSRARSQTIEQMQEGYLLVDPNSRIIDANATAHGILGEGESLTGTDIEAALSNYASHAPIGDSSTTFETDVDRGDTVVTVETSASPLIQNGQLIGTLCVFRDITERKQYQRDLQSQRDSLELLNTVAPLNARQRRNQNCDMQFSTSRCSLPPDFQINRFDFSLLAQ